MTRALGREIAQLDVVARPVAMTVVEPVLRSVVRCKHNEKHVVFLSSLAGYTIVYLVQPKAQASACFHDLICCAVVGPLREARPQNGMEECGSMILRAIRPEQPQGRLAPFIRRALMRCMQPPQ